MNAPPYQQPTVVQTNYAPQPATVIRYAPTQDSGRTFLLE